MQKASRSFSASSIAYVEMLITAALENGASLGDRIAAAGKDPVVTEGKKGFDLSDRDIRVLAEIGKLYDELEWSPTLEELIALRGKMLRENREVPTGSE